MAGDNSFLQNIGAPGMPGINGPQMFFDKNFKNVPAPPKASDSNNGQYTEGWLTVPGIKDKRWRDSDGNFSELRPGFGSQTMGGAAKVFTNLFRENKERSFPKQFKDEYDADPAYDIPEIVIEPSKNPPTPIPTPTPEITGPIPETTRVNKNGVVQKGTDMSRSFNDLLGGVGQVPYSSNQLPTTQSNPFSATPSQTPGFPTDTPDIGGYNGATYDSETGRQAAGSRDLSQFSPMTGKEQQIAGAAQRTGGGTLSEALADTAGINSYMDKFSSGDRQRAASSAFLNADDSMSGLKARDAVNDVVYAGGQHYGRGALSDDAGIGDKYKIDRADARGIASGKNTAAGLLDIYKSRITSASKESTPVEQQAPAYLERGARDGAFQQDKPMFSGSTPAIGGSIEFDNNNDQTLPTFGAPKGLKPQSTYKDPSFPNPFG